VIDVLLGEGNAHFGNDFGSAYFYAHAFEGPLDIFGGECFGGVVGGWTADGEDGFIEGVLGHRS
jgi:hypothetical protein